jgi:putative salt-induced outer membrane protein
MHSKKWIALVFLLIATRVMAAEPAEDQADKKSKWNGEAELGLVNTTGNTETESFVLKAKVINTRDKWKHTVQGEALRKADDEIVTAERYFLSGKSQYTFRDRSYLYGLVTYEDDRFNGFDYQLTGVLGYGRTVWERETVKLDLEVGAGGRHSVLDTGQSNDEAVFRAAGDFEWKISKNATFVQELSGDFGSDATITRSLTALTANINSFLSSRIAYQLRHTSKVPPGIEKTDTELTFTLVAKY